VLVTTGLLNDFNLRLCGLVVSVEDYKHRGLGFDSRALLRIFPRGSTQPRDRIN
jgi:hypothetical protein